MQEDRKDKGAVGWDYQAKTEKHASQKGLQLFADMFCEVENRNFSVIVSTIIITIVVIEPQKMWHGGTHHSGKNLHMTVISLSGVFTF